MGNKLWLGYGFKGGAIHFIQNMKIQPLLATIKMG